MIDIASRRRWLGALTQLKCELDFLFTSIQNEINAARHITADRDEPAIPSLSDLVGELAQIDDDFGEWSYDHRGGVLSINTEPITLEGIDLGRFAIKLEVRRLADADHHRIYQVEALEANPAEGNDGVTHPHVKNDDLCEGDAAAAIKAGHFNRALVPVLNPDGSVALDAAYRAICLITAASVPRSDTGELAGPAQAPSTKDEHE